MSADRIRKLQVRLNEQNRTKRKWRFLVWCEQENQAPLAVKHNTLEEAVEDAKNFATANPVCEVFVFELRGSAQTIPEVATFYPVTPSKPRRACGDSDGMDCSHEGCPYPQPT